MSPTAPTASSGSVIASSPLYTSKSPGAAAITVAVTAGVPAASLTPTMLGTSSARRTSTSGAILRPVRIGMSYTITGNGVDAATARRWASMPACEGRL